jgi:hypothetical protein
MPSLTQNLFLSIIKKGHQTSLLLIQGELEENHEREQPLATIISHLSVASVCFLTHHYTTTFDPLSLSMETPQKKKSHKGGSVVRTEPFDMHLFDVEPMVREVFQSVGCLSFFQNI